MALQEHLYQGSLLVLDSTLLLYLRSLQVQRYSYYLKMVYLTNPTNQKAMIHYFTSLLTVLNLVKLLNLLSYWKVLVLLYHLLHQKPLHPLQQGHFYYLKMVHLTNPTNQKEMIHYLVCYPL
ncbi:hypothetical protein PVT01_000005200 [Plasmodium vivax]|uniref:Uncharacterized protein n=1 Tax=Plasmodium vivax TaxID=5855 RepID=A0A1G4EHY6_PLAVI|nr:hypothetical protein PVT01_000005200 [Plasmodium vivax]